jgi:hypothetical protein
VALQCSSESKLLIAVAIEVTPQVQTVLNTYHVMCLLSTLQLLHTSLTFFGPQASGRFAQPYVCPSGGSVTKTPLLRLHSAPHAIRMSSSKNGSVSTVILGSSTHLARHAACGAVLQSEVFLLVNSLAITVSTHCIAVFSCKYSRGCNHTVDTQRCCANLKPRSSSASI